MLCGLVWEQRKELTKNSNIKCCPTIPCTHVTPLGFKCCDGCVAATRAVKVFIITVPVTRDRVSIDFTTAVQGEGISVDSLYNI